MFSAADTIPPNGGIEGRSDSRSNDQRMGNGERNMPGTDTSNFGPTRDWQILGRLVVVAEMSLANRVRQ